LVRDRDTKSVFVEDPVVGALKTCLLVPVPGGTANVRDLLDGGKLASSFVKVITFIARLTGSSVIEGSALIRNRDTNVVIVEHPIVRALKTDLFVPVPGSTSDIRYLLDWRKAAFSIVEVISFIA